MRSSARSKPSPRRVLVLAAGSVLAALGLAEVTLRVVDLPPTASTFGFLGGILSEGDQYAPDRARFWKLQPSPPFANEAGLRGWLPAEGPAGADTLRIACVGDSCTFGAHVRYEESYAMVLEAMLRQRLPNRRVETVVAGVPGYSTWQDRAVYEQHAVAMQPDVTVLYCGGWNDYVPAFGESDRERATQWRLRRLLRGVGGAPTEAEREELWAAFRAGDAPDGRRVPPADFLENMEALLRMATEHGGRVVLVIPPLDSETEARTPVALEYRQMVIDLAEREQLRVVDGPALFAGRRAEAAPPEDFPSTWPCLYDWVHPSVLGHRLLGEALFEVFEAEGWLVDSDARVAPRVDSIRSLEPGRFELRGAGFDEAAVERVFAGPFWLPGHHVVDGSTIEVTVPPGLPPGDQPLTLVGGFGARVLDVQVPIAPPVLSAEVEAAADGGLRAVFRAEGPPSWRVHAWLGPLALGEPERTRHGPFWLAGADAARPAGRGEEPFLFERVPIDPIDGEFDADGVWRHQIDVDAATASTLPDRLYLQAIVYEPPSTGRASLTGLVVVELR
ncbi:MAG: SGNH/GDSL hydrolase family protein [Planctomycetota bacterium]|nr:SGNH/GDSL hydrolase family protein [Planctomycetota bacterium]MDA0933858.1 SGNH/GDSL hydrolase family protein [Planctomycetota bacterium]